ncbi:MAG TPA: adenosine deaminase [Polyangiaceae bacterium]|jgi:adenosine deaminase|nr:adenosine deaminase [Polyangiaceae bacterium]
MDHTNKETSVAAVDADETEGQVPFEVFRALPKTDLHVHLDGSLRLQTILELAKAEHVELPASDVDGLRTAIGCGNNFGSLLEYLRGFDITLRVMQNEAALERIAFELAEDAHRENVRYMEVRYAPMLHTQRGLKLTKVVEAVLDGLRRARETYGIKANVIVCGIRNISPESSYQMAELAVAYKGRGVVGFDLAGAEADFPPKHHRAAFQLVRDNNINCTIHAGEAYGPESIAQAIHVCGAHRIGHGCRLREDGDLLHYLNDHRVPLECCPSSNVQTGAVKDLASHPIKLYFDLGLRVTVNTDNRLITDTSVSKELYLVHTKMGVPFADIKSMVVAGFKSSFQPFHEKQAALRRVGAELDKYDDNGVLRAVGGAALADRPSRRPRGSAEIVADAE